MARQAARRTRRGGAGMAGASRPCPMTSARSSSVTPPGRSSTGTGPVRSSTVELDADRTGTAVEDHRRDAELARSPIREFARHCAAVVGLTRPERLADGAATGRPTARSSVCATGCAGARTATVSSPALASSDTPPSVRRGSTRVSGPGQKRRAAARPVVEHGQRLRLGEPRDVHDQRVEARPSFRGEDGGDGAVVCRVAAEPVHGLGRKGDEERRRAAGSPRAGSRPRSRIRVQLPWSPASGLPSPLWQALRRAGRPRSDRPA